MPQKCVSGIRALLNELQEKNTFYILIELPPMGANKKRKFISYAICNAMAMRCQCFDAFHFIVCSHAQGHFTREHDCLGCIKTLAQFAS